jgi:hypothetical protein
MNQETLNIAYFIGVMVVTLFIIIRILNSPVRFTRRRGSYRRRIERMDDQIERIDDTQITMIRDVMELQMKIFPERFNDVDNDNK